MKVLPARSIDEEELGLCEAGMPRLEAVDGGLDLADDCLLVWVKQRGLTVHPALQLSTVVAELCHQHLVDLTPWCMGLRQAQGPEALAVELQALLNVSQSHVKVALLEGDFLKGGLRRRVTCLTCCTLQRQDTQVPAR